MTYEFIGPLTTTRNSITAAEDPYYQDTEIRKSWYLEGSSRSSLRIDVEPVWEDYTGEGVTVAVLDSQIDASHKELRSAYDSTQDYDFAAGTGDFDATQADITNGHGTMVAGVISSEAGNKNGSAGIAHGATLVGLAMDYSSSSVVGQALAGLRAGAEFDVLNNSWSFTANFADNFTKTDMEDTLIFTASEGRDGLGTSMVFAAGNSGISGTSNYHNFQNSPYTIAVGAVARDGDAASFTSIGANVLLSAGGEDVFSTLPGQDFGAVDGTSFAAPAVSAVIALMLEANPNLGYRDIQQILALSARKDGLGEHSSHGDDWVTNGADNFNGGGMHFSDSFGYGMLNAHDAVRLAETWTDQQTLDNRTTVTQDVSVDEYLIAGENDRIEVDIQLDQNIQAEHVQLTMNLSWSLTGDLDVWLVSPEGTAVRLVHDLPGLEKIGSLKNFALSSVASMGEMSAGTWTLVLQNNNSTATDGKGEPVTGRLRDVTLEVHGAAEIIDDVYVYTDEFGVLYDGGDLVERQVLSDIDGGEDTINAAAVTSDSVIDLSGSRQSVIADQALFLAGGQIEHAFSGDGADILSGNAADNHLVGGRGDDLLFLGAGSDTLDGGAGSDTLLIDSTIDSISGYITDAGSFMLGLKADTWSLVTGIETYQFNDVVYSQSDLTDYLTGAGYTGGGDTETETGGGDTETETGGGDTETETGGGDTETETGGGNTETETGGGDTETETGGGDTETETGGGDTETETGGGGDVPVRDPADYAEALEGTAGSETLRAAGDGNTWMSGMAGDDYLAGKGGDDYLAGDAGADKVRAGAGDDIVYGGIGADTLIGQDGNDWIDGGDEADVLRGDAGADTLNGGSGSDRLQGGGGADIFVFSIADAGAVDRISDFDASEGDMLMIEGVGANDASFHLVDAGRVTQLEMHTGDDVIVLADILGSGLNGLTLSEQEGTGSLLFA